MAKSCFLSVKNLSDRMTISLHFSCQKRAIFLIFHGKYKSSSHPNDNDDNDKESSKAVWILDTYVPNLSLILRLYQLITTRHHHVLAKWRWSSECDG